MVRHHGSVDRADVAVAIASMLRPSLEKAVDSVFAQRFAGRIHLLIGVDHGRENLAMVDRLAASRPERVSVSIVDPGYSTGLRRGGFHPARSGGALRTVLSYAAASPLVAHLDDDNWWAEDHLASLVRAVRGKDWAFSYRLFVAEDGETVLHRDIWESLGPGAGTYVPRFGGFCDTNTLIIDGSRVPEAARLWSLAYEDSSGRGHDRWVFDLLRKRPFSRTDRATAYYTLKAGDPMYARRLARIRRQFLADFDGFVAYRQGRYRDAAEAFGRLALVQPGRTAIHGWLALVHARAGLPEPPPVEAAAADRCLAVLRGEALPERDATPSIEAARDAFFVGARALLADDPESARAWFERVPALATENAKEIAAAAAADLRRLDAVRPDGPRPQR